MLTVSNIINECGEILINFSNVLFRKNVNSAFNASYESLKWTTFHCIKTFTTDSNFGTFSLFLSLSMTYFVLPNNAIVSLQLS